MYLAYFVNRITLRLTFFSEDYIVAELLLTNIITVTDIFIKQVMAFLFLYEKICYRHHFRNYAIVYLLAYLPIALVAHILN